MKYMKYYSDFERQELEDLLLMIWMLQDKIDASHLKFKIEKMLEFHHWQDGLLAKAVNDQMEQIIDMGLPLYKTVELLGEFWASLKPETKRAGAGGFSEKVSGFLKEYQIELCRE